MGTEFSDLEAELRHTPNIELVRRLGDGANGLVYEGRLRSQRRSASGVRRHAGRDADDRRIALKFIRLDQIQGLVDECAREVFNQYKLAGHRSIVKLHDVVRTENYLVLVLDLCQGDTLFRFIQKHGQMSEDQVQEILRQIVVAVEYCHAKGICIRDIKPQNILFVEDPKTSLRIKMCDFGFSKDAYEHSRAGSLAGTPHFVAPEIVEAQGVPEGHYDGKAADIWSIGVTLYVMMYHQYPFPDERPRRCDVANLKFPDTPNTPDTPVTSPENLLKCMLRPEPLDRYTARQVMTHPWFRRGMSDSELNENLLYNDRVRILFEDQHRSWYERKRSEADSIFQDLD
eukprot:jgi/Picsp_1/1535/NSC_05013-R1_serine threonine protein kinase